MYSVYGPRTMFVVAYADGAGNQTVQQYVQTQQPGSGARWVLQRVHSGLKHTKIIAPANLRAAADNGAYRSLVDTWINKVRSRMFLVWLGVWVWWCGCGCSS